MKEMVLKGWEVLAVAPESTYGEKLENEGIPFFSLTMDRKGKNPFSNYDLSRHGIVVWGGLGSIGKDIAGLDNWLTNYGFGYRFEVQPRVNLRVDVGFGNDSMGFYVNFNEAF
jgi:hypothetical protein